jgi:hypothetical protein
MDEETQTKVIYAIGLMIMICVGVGLFLIEG